MYFKLTLVRLCTDLNKTIEWYRKFFNASVVVNSDTIIDEKTISTIFSKPISDMVTLTIGKEYLIFGETTDFDGGLQFPVPNNTNFQHIAVIVGNIDKTYKLLSKNEVKIVSKKPQTIPKTNLKAGGIKVLYLYDNNGFPIALVEYPIGKGKEKWSQDHSDIKGIDHSAIVVDSLNDSVDWYEEIGFYTDVEDKREGKEQDELTGISNAKVRLKGLEGTDTYGIELIEYISPETPKITATSRQQVMILQSPKIGKKRLVKDPSNNLLYFSN